MTFGSSLVILQNTIASVADHCCDHKLREYLNYASDPNDVTMAKRYLSELEKALK